MCKKKVFGKVKEVKNLETFYCNLCVEKMTKTSDDERFCIFLTKDKGQAIILTMSYIEYLQILTAKAVSNFLPLIVIFKLF